MLKDSKLKSNGDFILTVPGAQHQILRVRSLEGHPLDLRFKWRLYAALVAAAWLINYPGRLNWDSYDMLTQAEAVEVLSDWHSPAVTWLWSLFAPVLGQPAGALLVQSLLIFVYPVVLWMKRDRTPVGFGIAHLVFFVGYTILVLSLLPLTGQIIKDVILVGLILCLLSIVHLNSEVRDNVSAWCWCTFYSPIALLILLVRPSNFIIILFPLISVANIVFGKSLRFVIFSALIFVGCVISVPVTSLFTKLVFGAKYARTEYSLMIFDVAGISSQVKVNFFAELPTWPTDQIPRPWDCYTPSGWEPFGWGKCSKYVDLVDTRMAEIGTIPVMRWWANTILRHPYSYIKHRLSYFTQLMVNPTRIFPRVSSSTDASNSPDGSRVREIYDRYGIDTTQSFQMWKPTIRYRPFELVSRLFFSRTIGIATLLTCMISLVWCWHKMLSNRRCDMVMLVSSAIGVGNVFMLLLCGISPQLRYLLPSTVCGAVSALRLYNYYCDYPYELVSGNEIGG
jgi:hypothetical protein